MAKIRDLHIYSQNHSELKRLHEDYEFIGRRTELRRDELVVFSMPKTWKRKQERERKLAARRAERQGIDPDSREDRPY